MPDKSDQRISFTCPECEAHLKVPASLAGVSGPCPKCHATITAPDPDPTPEETVAPELPPIPKKEIVDNSSAPPIDENAVGLEPGDAQSLASNIEPHVGTTGSKEEGGSRNKEDSTQANEGEDVRDEEQAVDPTAKTGTHELPQTEEGGVTVDAAAPDIQKSEESKKETSFRILPAPVHDAQPHASFPPFPPFPSASQAEGETHPQNPPEALAPIDNALPNPPQSGSDDSIPPIGSTMPVSPGDDLDDTVPPYGSTMPIPPNPEPTGEHSPIATILPTPPLPGLTDALPATGSGDENVVVDTSAGEAMPSVEEDSDPEPGLEPDSSQVHEAGVSEKARLPEPPLENLVPFQPFFLPGQTPPNLDASIHTPPVFPNQAIPDSPPGKQTNALASVENPNPTKEDPTPQLIPHPPSTPPPPAPARFNFPTTGNKTSAIPEPNTNPSTSLETDPSSVDDEPTPAGVLSSVSGSLESIRGKSALIRKQMENSGFIGLFKTLLIFTLVVFGGIALLVADFYAGGIPLFHKLPGVKPLTSLVSSILTPPNMEPDGKNLAPDKPASKAANLDSATDTIAQADISSPLENISTVVDTVAPSPAAQAPAPPLPPVISPPPALPPGPAPGTPSISDTTAAPTESSGQAMKPAEPPSNPKDAPPPPPSTPAQPTLATAGSEPSPPVEMGVSASPGKSSPIPGTASAAPSTVFSDESDSDTSKMASYLPDPSLEGSIPSAPSLPTKTDPVETKPDSPTPEMVRAVPIELPDPIPTDNDKQPATQSPPSIVVDLTKNAESNEPKSPPNSPDTGKTLSEPRHVVEAFLRAPSWKERLPYIYNGEALKEIIEGYYQQDPQEAITDYTLEFINMERSRTDNTLFYVFLLTTKRLPDGFPIILRTENGKLKVDWEIFAEFNDQHFKYFVKSEDRGPHPLRLMLKRASYWGPDKERFTDLDDYLCFGVSAPPFLEKGEFTFVKRGTPLAKQLEASLPWGKRPLSGIVELEKVKFAHGVDHLVIKRVITDGWFSVAEEENP